MKNKNRTQKTRISLNKTFLFFVHLIFLVSFISYPVLSQTPPSADEVGIDERLGETLPMDLTFYDEYGKTVTLGELIGDKPTVISIVYYRCPGLCSPLLAGLADVVDKVDLEPGDDFNVLTISMDPSEDYHMASEKKKNYIASLTRNVDFNDWRFLTSDSINSRRITDAVGWKYQKQDNDFMHGAALTVVSPDGKIVRYLFGTEYNVFDFKMALIEASEGRVGASIAKVLQVCFSYDPNGRKYTLDITRITGGIVVFLIGIFAVVFLVKKKKKVQTNEG